MTDSNRRVLRSAYQILTALIVAVPLVVFALPDDIQTGPLAVGIGVWIGVVVKAINSLEDAGLIPAWLKG